MRPNGSDLVTKSLHPILKTFIRGRWKLENYRTLFVVSNEFGITTQSPRTLMDSVYLNVFPDELMEITTDREVELCIHLVPGI